MKSNIQSELKKLDVPLKAFSLRLTQNQTDAEDLYQDTTLVIITKIEQFQPGTNFKAWASAIMRNLFIESCRKKSRRVAIQNKIIDYQPSWGLINHTKSNNGETNLNYKELRLMINTLNLELRVPFWMSYQGYKYQEIANHLNIPVGTIKSRVFFARKKLRGIYNSIYN